VVSREIVTATSQRVFSTIFSAALFLLSAGCVSPVQRHVTTFIDVDRSPAGVSSTPANRIGRFPDPATLTSNDLLGLFPDSSLTPGAIDPCVHAKDICAEGTTTKGRRTTTAKQKKEALDSYLAKYPSYKDVITKDQVHGQDGEGFFEIDHVISLEIGGADDPKNLWPEPFQLETAGAADKDRIEHHSKPEMCDLLTAKGEEAADEFLALIQRAISAGFSVNAQGQLVPPIFGWYHLYYKQVLPNLDSDRNQKPNADISFWTTLQEQKQLIKKLPPPLIAPSDKNCIAPKIN
jgi:hypothetical protein